MVKRGGPNDRCSGGQAADWLPSAPSWRLPPARRRRDAKSARFPPGNRPPIAENDHRMWTAWTTDGFDPITDFVRLFRRDGVIGGRGPAQDDGPGAPDP